MREKRRKGRVTTKTSVEDEIVHLRGLDLKGLRARWQSVLQRPAPDHLPRHLLFAIIAYRIQADRFGDLDHETRYTKHARILAMLRTPAGATIAAIMAATEWQQHSVRGFLAGVVRKKLALNLVSELTDNGRVYRIKDSKASSGAADRVKQAA